MRGRTRLCGRESARKNGKAPLDEMDRAALRDLVDREEVDELHSRYLFVLEWAGGVVEERDVLREAIRNMQAFFGKSERADAPLRPSRLRHFVTNKLIRIDGDTAHTIAFWFEIDNDNRQRWPYVCAYGHYEDELLRTADGRRFKRRKIFNELMDERTAPVRNPAW